VNTGASGHPEPARTGPGGFAGKLLANVRELILPYLDRLKSDHLNESQRPASRSSKAI
jgi:hypothetical protein